MCVRATSGGGKWTRVFCSRELSVSEAACKEETSQEPTKDREGAHKPPPTPEELLTADDLGSSGRQFPLRVRPAVMAHTLGTWAAQTGPTGH